MEPDFARIADLGGSGALALVADLMQRDAAQTASILQSLYEGERAAHEKTKAQLAVAEARMARAQDRLAALFAYDPDYWSEP